MELLNIDKTIKTPKVVFDYENGELLIEGISIPENTTGFYENILKWVENYQKQPQPKTTLTLKLEYFNTSTSVVLLSLLKKFKQIKNSDLKVIWYYEEEDLEMEEVGEDYQSIIKIPFELVSVESF